MSELETTTEAEDQRTRVDRIVMPCLLCGSHDVDAVGWENGKGDSGPQCLSCGTTGESVAIWNDRDWIIERVTTAIVETLKINDSTRAGHCSTDDDWRGLIKSVVEA